MKYDREDFVKQVHNDYEQRYTLEERTEFDRRGDELWQKALEGKLTDDELRTTHGLPWFIYSEIGNRNRREQRNNTFREEYVGKRVRVALERIIPFELGDSLAGLQCLKEAGVANGEEYAAKLKEGFDQAGITEGETYEVTDAWAQGYDLPLPFTNETGLGSYVYMAHGEIPEGTLKLKIGDREAYAYAHFFDVVE